MYNRWYDRYPDLKSLLMMLEQVDSQYIDFIAHDFLQVILEKYNDKFDIFMKEISENPPPRYNRWYDENYELHTCIEFVRNLDDDNARNELISLFIMSLLTFITNVDDE